MELQSLGSYRLLAPFPTRSALCRFQLARHAEDPDQQPATCVAKLLLPGRHGQATLRAQFEHEIRLLKAFNHPGIPTVRADGEHDGVLYYVMDLVDGVDLAALLGHDREATISLPKELAVYVMGQLADALNHVHDLATIHDDGAAEPLAVLHRDVCPANVLISREGDVVLCDFGAATSRWLASDHDEAQVGHRAYMAPERITGSGKASVASDLFSLAVVLWEMLRGERCFRGANDLETIDAIARFDIGHSSRRIGGLSPKLGEILRRNLDRDPTRRYENAYQMLQRLSQAPEARSAEQARLQLGAMVEQAMAARP